MKEEGCCPLRPSSTCSLFGLCCCVYGRNLVIMSTIHRSTIVWDIMVIHCGLCAARLVISLAVELGFLVGECFLERE